MQPQQHFCKEHINISKLKWHFLIYCLYRGEDIARQNLNFLIDSNKLVSFFTKEHLNRLRISEAGKRKLENNRNTNLNL